MFLDIRMENLTGIQMLKVLPDRPLVIFTTAYESYALKGYELDVTEYRLQRVIFADILYIEGRRGSCDF